MDVTVLKLKLNLQKQVTGLICPLGYNLFGYDLMTAIRIRNLGIRQFQHSSFVQFLKSILKATRIEE